MLLLYEKIGCKSSANPDDVVDYVLPWIYIVSKRGYRDLYVFSMKMLEKRTPVVMHSQQLISYVDISHIFHTTSCINGLFVGSMGHTAKTVCHHRPLCYCCFVDPDPHADSQYSSYDQCSRPLAGEAIRAPVTVFVTSSRSFRIERKSCAECWLIITMVFTLS